MTLHDADQLASSILRKARQHPDYDGTRLTRLIVSCHSEFEPWGTAGTASETFEDVWAVQLPPLGERWRGRTLKAALERTLCWLECEEEKRSENTP